MFVFAILITGKISFNFVLYSLAFLELMPKFKCLMENGEYEPCSQEHICKTDTTQYIVDYDDQTSLDNWVMQLDLVCESKFKIGMIGSSFFIGWTLTTILLPAMADKYGRKWIFRLSTLTTGIAMVFLLISTELYLTVLMMFICGLATPGRISVGFVYGTEFFPKSLRSVYGTCFLVIDTCTLPLTALYFGWVDVDYRPLLIFGTSFSFFSCAGQFMFIPESPLWLLKTG